jgi:hypothetical protein
MYKRLYFIGIIAYALMFVLAVLFYKERIIILDTSFTLFHIINEHFFSIQVYRFGDAFNQSFPLLASMAGLSINGVLLCYSLGYMSCFFLCYVVVGPVLRQYDFALVILLLNVLFVADTFYWVTSQLPQALALLMVVLAYLRNKQDSDTKIMTWIMAIIGLVTVAFFHPLAAFVLAYAVFFFVSRNESFLKRKVLYGIWLIFVLAIEVKAIVFETPYEHSSMSGLKNFITQFPDYFTLFSNRQFLKNCVTEYYWIPILFLLVVVYYVAQKAWKKLLWFVAFFFGYLLLINVSYPTNVTPSFYIESLYMPLSIFIGLPFVFDILPALQKKGVAIPLTVLIVATGVLRIYFAHVPFTARLDYERTYLDKYGASKVIVRSNETDDEVLKLLWGSPYEMLFLSLSERHQPASIIIDKDPMYRPWAPFVNKAIIVNWGIYWYKDLNQQYFHFTDTTSGYTIIK